MLTNVTTEFDYSFLKKVGFHEENISCVWKDLKSAASRSPDWRTKTPCSSSHVLLDWAYCEQLWPILNILYLFAVSTEPPWNWSFNRVCGPHPNHPYDPAGHNAALLRQYVMLLLLTRSLTFPLHSERAKLTKSKREVSVSVKEEQQGLWNLCGVLTRPQTCILGPFQKAGFTKILN